MNRLLAVAAVAMLTTAARATIAPAATGATVIDFNDNADDVYWTSSVTSRGYVATELNRESGMAPLGTNVAVDGYGMSNGTVHLDSWTNYTSDSAWTLTKSGGTAFSLYSFDFASGYPGNDEAASSLTVTGHRADGATVSEVLTPATQSFETLTLARGFNDLTSVTFDAHGAGNRAAYDNISVSVVPEPSMALLMVAGLGGLLVARRKRQA